MQGILLIPNTKTLGQNMTKGKKTSLILRPSFQETLQKRHLPLEMKNTTQELELRSPEGSVGKRV